MACKVNRLLQSNIKMCKNRNRQWTQIIAVLSASFYGCISGFAGAWPSPSIPKLMANDSYVPMTFEQTSYFAVLHPLGMMLFGPFAAILNEKFGRKKSILTISVIQLTAWLCVGFGRSIAVFYVSRIIAGMSDALLFCSIPVYMAEITEKHIRGPLSCSLTAFFSLGQICINAVGYYLDIPTTAFIISAFPVVHFLVFLLMPESPYWLIGKNNFKEARRQLQLLRWREDVEEEFGEIQKAVQRQLSERSYFKDLFVSDSNRKALFIALIVRTTQQFSGITAMNTFLQYIFQEAGGNIPSHISSIIATTVSGISTVVAARYINKFGRRPLMMISSIGCIISLFVQGTFFYLKDITDISSVSWLLLPILLMYMVFFSFGLSIIPTMLVGELFSASIKGKAVTVVNICFSILIMVSGKLFQLFADYVGFYAPFFFYGTTTAVLVVVVHLTMIETKNRSLEEIQLDLKKRKISIFTVKQ